MHYTVYKTTNLVNGKIYIGVHHTENIDDNYLGSGKLLRLAVNKYGKDKFNKTILYDYDNAKDMYDKEIEIVNENFIKRKDTYNITCGGLGGPQPEEILKKMSGPRPSIAGKNNPMYGKTHTDKTRKTISRKNKGRIVSEEIKRKISKANKGKNNPMYGKTGEDSPMYGKHHSEETKKKMSISNSNPSVERRQKLSKSLKGKKKTEEHKKHLRENHPDFNGKKNPFYGKKHTDESRQKMSESSKGQVAWNKGRKYLEISGEKHYLYGKHHSEESKKKMSESLKGRIPWNKGLTSLCWIYNEETEKTKQVKDIQKWLDKGWKMGRPKKYQIKKHDTSGNDLTGTVNGATRTKKMVYSN